MCFFLLEISAFFCQEKNDAINTTIVNSLPENVSIVGLGDPTHQESTITKYRIDLIKKLVTKKEFKVIAIEGNIYELYKAHQRFLQDKGIFYYDKLFLLKNFFIFRKKHFEVYLKQRPFWRKWLVP